MADGTNNTVTVTLPNPATLQQGQMLVIKALNIDNQVDVDTTAGLIDGESSYIIYSLYESITVIADGTNYNII